jgi:hypothetical protein
VTRHGLHPKVVVLRIEGLVVVPQLRSEATQRVLILLDAMMEAVALTFHARPVASVFSKRSASLATSASTITE